MISAKLLLLLTGLIAGEAGVQRDGKIETHNFVVHYGSPADAEDANRIADQIEQDYLYYREHFNLSASSRTAVFMHSSRHDFVRETGLPAWMYAAQNDRGIHLMPSGDLRRSGRFSYIISQQAVRLVLHSRRLNGCPLWLYEGTAAFFAGIDRVGPAQENFPYRLFSDMDEQLLLAHSESEYNATMYFAALTIQTFQERYGDAAVITLLRLFNGENDLDAALRQSLGVTQSRAESVWITDIRKALETSGRVRGRD